MPALIQKLQKMLVNPNTPIQSVAREIEMDAGLSALILRVVNSAAYAVANKISSIIRAVTFIGYQTTRRTVSVAGLMSKLGEEDAALNYDLKAHWGHSLWVGHITSQLCEIARKGDPDEFFSAGLLHDVGKLVEYQYLKHAMRMILPAVQAGARYDMIERRALGVTHAVIGAYVCERWGFPAELLAAVRRHLDPFDSFEKNPDPAQALYVAAGCQLSKSPETVEAWSKLLGVGVERLNDVLKEAQQLSVGSLRDIFMYA
jgi:putative nucleotidyltransferase with HDIG domain